MGNVYMEDKIWFSPLNVIYHYDKLLNNFGNNIDRIKWKKMVEAYRVAVMLIGIIATTKKEYWMQFVPDSYGSPDIRTGSYKDELEGNDFERQDVEVVEWSENSEYNSIFDFLIKTKLSKKKSYDSLTTILCYINKSAYLNYSDLHGRLIKTFNKNNNPQVMILGKVNQNVNIYKLVKVFPVLDICPKFDIQNELKNKKYRGVLKMKKSISGVISLIYNKDEKHYPFENL